MHHYKRLFIFIVGLLFTTSTHAAELTTPRLTTIDNKIDWATVNSLFAAGANRPNAVSLNSRTFNVLRSQRRHLKHQGQPYQVDTVTARAALTAGGIESLSGVRLEIGGDVVYRFYLHHGQSITDMLFRPNAVRPIINEIIVPTEVEDDAVVAPPTFSSSNDTAPPSASTQAGTSTLTMMVVYTTAALNQAGSLANMLSAINASIAESNTTFLNSGIDAQVQLVHTEEVSNCMELAPVGQGTDPGNQLGLLAGTTDGCNDQVHAIRDQTGIEADLVQGVVSHFQGSVAGIGYLWQSYCWNNGCNFSGNAFSLVMQGYEVYSGTHEMGHNLGCNHNPENAGSSSPILPGGFGHWGSNWRTQMSYGTQTRIPYFSNPSLTYGTDVIGITNQRDNSLLLRLTIPVAATWRGGGGTNPQVPPPVTNVTATQNLIGRVDLTWSLNSAATSYEVFRNATCQGTPIATLTATQTTDSTLPAFSTTYSYTVRGVNTNGAGDCSVAANGLALPKTTPVENFAASDGAFANKIDLTWQAVDIGATNLLQVFRSASSSTVGCQTADLLVELGATATNHTDMTAETNTNYRYSILRKNSDDTPSDCITDTGFTWSTQATQNSNPDSTNSGNLVSNAAHADSVSSVVQSAACGLILPQQPDATDATRAALIMMGIIFIALLLLRRA